MFTPECIPELEEVRRELRRRSLLRYVKYVMPIYQAGWMHIELIEALEQFLQDVIDKKSPRLIISMPPRHGKSQLTSVFFPSWALGKYPNLEFILGSYNKDKATDFTLESRDLIESEKHLEVFPDFRLNQSEKGKSKWKTTCTKGGYMAVGVGGGSTGSGADVFIIDDPVKNYEEAYSLIYRNRVDNWSQSVTNTRLAPGAGIIIIMTRWHEDDLVGRILAKEEKIQEENKRLDINDAFQPWKIFDYPAIAVKDEKHRKKGEALHPERYPIQVLESIKRRFSPRIWNSLYQGRPRPDNGEHINRDWFNIIPATSLPQGLVWRRGWDLAIQAKQSSDFTAGIRGAMDTQGNLYLMSGLKFKKIWPQTKRIITEVAKKEKIQIGIEDVGAFSIAMQEIKKGLRGIIPVRGVSLDKGDKLVRAFPWIDLAEQGKVFLVEGAWVEDFLDECVLFNPIKDASHDDMIDAVTTVHKMVRRIMRGGNKATEQDDRYPQGVK